MTLDQMNKYFEDRGFTVDRMRDSKRDVYIFNIVKNGRDLTGEFKYPKTSDWRYRNIEQRTFVEKLIRDFYKKEEENNMGMQEPHEIVFPNRGEAEIIIEKLQDIIDMHGCATVGDLHELAGLHSNYLESKFGWTNIRGAEINRVRDGYVIVLPKVKEFPSMLNETGKVKPRYISYNERYRRVSPSYSLPYIKDVIHNNPATIVFWADGTKTVVKCQPGDIYDPEKGLVMAISKKALGNEGNYCNVFKKWVPEGDYYSIGALPLDFLITELYKFGIKVDINFAPKDEPVVEQESRWEIWFKEFDDDGNEIASGRYHRDYSTKGSATRRARTLFSTDDWKHVEWIVSKTNPWNDD